MKVKRITPQYGDRVLIPGDMHFDQQDTPACELMCDVAEQTGVNAVVLVGDTFNSIGISRHATLRAARHYRWGKATIKAEKAAAEPVLNRLRSIVQFARGQGVFRDGPGTSAPGSTRPGGLYVLEGNHERWWTSVQDDYPGLMDTEWHELYGTLFDGWAFYGETEALKMGPLLVCHGHRLRGSLSKNSALSVLSNYPGQNTLYGHTHRVECATNPTWKDGEPVPHGAWTVGHMKTIDSEHDDPHIGPYSERHQQGFALVDFFDRGGDVGFNVTQVRIHRTVDGKPMCVVDGKVYS